ncbi:MAG: tRNA dimethylallyltransferase [candidate division CPR2 bacterium GW2011_GWC1_39_9]|uniref:tRNA dimethylallyltransferase n=1 Tax=candidate division CPR2 bacterium GW2011_GWC2_39_10 TaxID=1618345 RepID=A0A0G0P7U0_UNCC2|nr:MAG: tRNA dimethylallyltransferase [candidate division CPR2 bacterium GW2011_GWC2_39_10]KKR35047.1 MAG: tRNA dimethylallyltransferase [candidate division CPR2 bacterium GW2011_GWC1_39_9]
MIVIIGPTASGKTSLSINLAKKFNGEIVNADSQNVYREMDIGTAKPSIEEQQEVPHHMLDIVDPDQEFNVAIYKKMAKEAIGKIQEAGKIPFLVGGTGLYIDALIYNYHIPEVKPDNKLRAELSLKDNDELAAILDELDPEAAGTIDPNNRRRVIRAIEIIKGSGKPLSAMRSMEGKPENVLMLGTAFYEKEELYERINLRVDQMFEEGFLEEFKELADSYPWDIPGFNALGYRQLALYFKKEIDLSMTMETIKKETRNYAKRQMTWFKRNKDIVWVRDEFQAFDIVEKFIAQ